MHPDSLLRFWRYINHLLTYFTYLLTYYYLLVDTKTVSHIH